MKLFSDPIPLEQAEFNEYIEVCYISQYDGEIKFIWGKRINRYPYHLTIQSGNNTRDIAIETRQMGYLIKSIRKINIDFSETYLFIINGHMDVTGTLAIPDLNGDTFIRVPNSHRVNIHISQITDVFQINEFSNIIYPLAAATGNGNTVLNTFVSMSDPEHEGFFNGGKKRKSVKRQKRRKN